jgi:anti-sigma regulatory factor (Ser/Thr protein kinase)
MTAADETQELFHARAAFPAVAEAVGDVRRWLRGVLAAQGRDEDLADTAVLLVSELVGNVVKHTDGTVLEVTVDCDQVVRAAVHDSEPSMPLLRRVGALETCGRGLSIVHELSNRWGATLYRAGKYVWFELADDVYETAAPRSVPAT